MASADEITFQTLQELFEASVERFAHRDLWGTKQQDGSWRWLTFREFSRVVDETRAGLSSLGVEAGDRVAIVSNNRVEWAAVAFASYGLGAAIVPMYEAQPPDEWVFILKDSGAKVVVGSTERVAAELSSRTVNLDTLQHVVCMDADAERSNSFAELRRMGRESPVNAVNPAATDLAGIIYTSGTTGKPKGVMLTHRNFCTNVVAAGSRYPLGPKDRSLCFLPWAHVFGQTAELYALMAHGSSVAINDTVPNLIENIGQVRPTLLVAVPSVFNKIYDRVTQQVEARPEPVRRVFYRAIRAASKKRRGERLGVRDRAATELAKRLFFSKVRARFGGRLAYCLSGSAALSPEVAEFIDAIGIPVYEGYGLTETSPGVATTYPGYHRIGSVGTPLSGVTVTLDHEATGSSVEGEILVQGPNVMVGYYNRPEETEAVLSEDGVFRTGDVGRFDADGFLYITGRIKEQYKLANGKYVAPAPLEETLKLSPYISQVMLFGSDRPYNVAVVAPEREAVERWARKNGRILGTMSSDGSLQALLLAEVERLSESFKHYERPRAVLVVDEEWTPESGILTPTLKVKRRRVTDLHQSEIDALYR